MKKLILLTMALGLTALVGCASKSKTTTTTTPPPGGYYGK